MSDKGSQNNSVRAGYRRSRVEPVDPATISAPPPKSVSPYANAQDDSTSDETAKKKEGICKKFLRILFLILNIFIMILAVMMIFVGTIIWILFRESGLSIISVAGGAPLILIINGILLVIFAMWGCEIALISGRKKTIMYLIVLTIMFGFSIFAYVRSRKLSDSIHDNLVHYWGTFSATTRSKIQDFGFCCGLNGPIDYPALPCPEGTIKGCLSAFNDMQSSVSSAANGFLGGNIVTFLLIAGSAAILGFTGEENKKTDEEGNDDSHSQI